MAHELALGGEEAHPALRFLSEEIAATRLPHRRPTLSRPTATAANRRSTSLEDGVIYQGSDRLDMERRASAATAADISPAASNDESAAELAAAIYEARSRRATIISKETVARIPELSAVAFRSPVDMCLGNRSILQLIVGHLEVPDMPAICRVCRTWNSAIDNRELWLRLFQTYEARVKGPNEAELNIWSSARSEEDKKVSLDKEGNIRWTTLNALVERLTPYQGIPDKLDEQVLLNTFTTFTTTQQLVRKLWERYNVPQPEKIDNFEKWAKEVKRPIQVRTAYILKALIALRWKESDKHLKRLVKVIIRLLDKNLSGVIKTQIMREDTKGRAESVVTSSAAPVAASPPAMLQKKATVFFSGLQHRELDKISSQDIARQLTLIDFQLYAKIQPQELNNQCWSKKNKEEQAPNILKLIDRFNITTRVIATSILQADKVKQRVKIMIKWIKVADCLRKMNNYHTLMAVLSGFQENSIFRLKFTKDETGPKYIKLLDELQELMNKDGSYANYRKAIAAAKPPCLPYIGIYLRDIIYIETGTPAEQEASEQSGVIQFRQKKKVFAIIHYLQNYQTMPYDFSAYDDLFEYIQHLPALSETELYDLSIKREPKTAKRATLL